MTSICGLLLNKEKYMIVNYLDHIPSIYLKNKTGGGCITKTNQCILIGLFNLEKGEGQNCGNCNKDVEELGDKLRKVGY